MPTTDRSSTNDLRDRVFRDMQAWALFRRMASRQGVDLCGSWWPGSGGMIFRALRECSACPWHETCQAWLDEEDRWPKCPSFCPNAGIIDCLVRLVQAQKAGAHLATRRDAEPPASG